MLSNKFYCVFFFPTCGKSQAISSKMGGKTAAISILHSLFVSGTLDLPPKSQGLDLPVNWHTCYQTRKLALSVVTYSPPCVCVCVCFR